MSSPLIVVEAAITICLAMFGVVVGSKVIEWAEARGKIIVDLLSYVLSAGYVAVLGSVLVVEAGLNAERGLQQLSSYILDQTTRAWIFVSIPWVLSFAFGLGLAKRLDDWKALGPLIPKVSAR
ncbi:MAG TPA: hypothetical protein VK434_15500 [Microvirga sp.]|jgi:hypothetical protein|nr:hypothetical protein [Microvirga sp.]